MRTIFSICLCLTFLSCTHISTGGAEKSFRDLTETSKKQSFSDSIKSLALAHEKLPLLQKVPSEFVVNEAIVDSDLVIIKEKCIVFSLYSDKELEDIEKSFKNKDNWDAYYDDLSFYANEASQFLTEKTTVKCESTKKYIQFVLITGEKITIDRNKSAETIFFFNPRTGIKQCDCQGFDKNKYRGY